MTFYNIFKLLIISIFLFNNCLAKTSKIQVIQDGYIQIIKVNGILNCDSLICPDNSWYCYVKIDTTPNDLLHAIRYRICMDIEGNVTKIEKDIKNNPTPNEDYHHSTDNYTF